MSAYTGQTERCNKRDFSSYSGDTRYQ